MTSAALGKALQVGTLIVTAAIGVRLAWKMALRLDEDENAERMGVSAECWAAGRSKMPAQWVGDSKLIRDLRRIQKRLERMTR